MLPCLMLSQTSLQLVSFSLTLAYSSRPAWAVPVLLLSLPGLRSAPLSSDLLDSFWCVFSPVVSSGSDWLFCILSLLVDVLTVPIPRPPESCEHLYGHDLGLLGFPGGSAGKESACNAGDPGSIFGSGRSPGEGNGNSLQFSCLENPMHRGVWGYSPWGHKELDTTE